ncbi:MAG: winged helix-turn-helix transcriptional regulator [Candidatus Marinimicrobia bacterium]|nr:winged helix-turn-helix transcriptional regulator [Candidatus Neomarinimicrobiota bacterium]
MAENIKRSCVRSYVDHDKIQQLQMELVLKDYDKLGETLSILSNPTRIKILDCLSKTNELCVCDLADILEMDVSAISHQLRKLKDRGFVNKRRDGLTIYYRLSLDKNCQKACDFIESLFVKESELIQ